jgi:glycerol-3-phosphate cytidylyltransferase
MYAFSGATVSIFKVSKEFVMEKVIGYTAGVFDLFHIGHLRILKKAKLNCDYLIVAVSSDELVASYKNKTPVIPLQHRMEIIASLKCVDEVVIQTSRDKLQALQNYGFNVMFVGDDWKGDPMWEKIEIQFQEQGARIVYFPYTKQISSTSLNRLLVEMDINCE